MELFPAFQGNVATASLQPTLLSLEGPYELTYETGSQWILFESFRQDNHQGGLQFLFKLEDRTALVYMVWTAVCLLSMLE